MLIKIVFIQAYFYLSFQMEVFAGRKKYLKKYLLWNFAKVPSIYTIKYSINLQHKKKLGLVDIALLVEC